MGEALPELCGENEVAIAGDEIDPLPRGFWLKRLIKRSIDFDGIEKFGEIGGFMKVLGAARGINVAGPVRVRPSGGPDAQSPRRGIVRLWVRFARGAPMLTGVESLGRVESP